MTTSYYFLSFILNWTLTESENEYWDDFISNECSNVNYRTQLIIIFWVNGNVLLLPDIIKPENIENDGGNILYGDLNIDASSNLLIDINKLLSKLTSSEIDILTLKALFPNDINSLEDSVIFGGQLNEDEKE